jgi:hypothetical protein
VRATAVEVEVDTDFSVEAYAQAPLDALQKARAAKDITQRTYWGGLRRFDVLPPDFDPDAEEDRPRDRATGPRARDRPERAHHHGRRLTKF